ncbi:hypothetical protein RBG61_01955 [Paludicola sp. MB14-C6]|uniref:hypothetical protein n=1 Tax=Paludihabitans sp. MB14-C6 TaxID=3070656 RepID=UPI0027DE1B8D|nr:hypothetical protein [Paludicola sp. MB14-C6]WMJ23455.1 hypothetical protein RBG61_01955 [Paludicola sp. MB14-C6]
MIIKIGQVDYEASPSFMSLVNYRVEYGKSFFAEEKSFEGLVKMIYVSIVGKKPYYHNFLNDCRADSLFEATALYFIKALMKHEEQNKNKENTGEIMDEYKVLALCGIAHIQETLLYKLNFFQVLSVIGHYCDIKTGNQQSKEMTSTQRKALYGITPEKEKEIEEYMMKCGENDGR